MALRGTCKRIRSDNGTNFIGAKNQMDCSIDLEKVRKEIAAAGCEWKLIPPSASHFAGVWERKIGSIKRVLSGALQQLGTRSLSRDEFHTLLQESASIVNNTPLWEISSDPNDPFPLSPANIITLRDSPNPPPPETFTPDDLLQYGKSRWRRVQYLSNQFWVRWRRDYLSTLQSRKKWKNPKPNIGPGDVILLKGNTPRNTWPMGLVTDVKLSRDGLVRSANIQLKSSQSGTRRSVERAIHDIVLLVPAQ